MSRFFKKFTRKKNTSMSGSKRDERNKEIEHGFDDNVGGINFPTASNSVRHLSPNSFSSQKPELTILWSHPRYGENSGQNNKVNPIFINEPTELYEAGFIPPDNAHDFSVLPRYRISDSRSIYDIDTAVQNENSGNYSSIYRSHSLGALSSYNYDNEGRNLAELKSKRREEQGASRGKLFGLFKDDHEASSDSTTKRDSGVYPALDNEEEHEVEELLARKLASFQKDQSGGSSAETHSDDIPMNDAQRITDARLTDDMIDETIRDSSLLISALESSRDSFQEPPQQQQTLDKKMFEDSNNNINSMVATENGRQIHQREYRLPRGTFFRSKSVSDVNSSILLQNKSLSSGEETTFSDDRSSSFNNDPLALREKNIFGRRGSPTLSAVRGRVSSVKRSLEREQDQYKSKSAFNLSARNNDNSDIDSDYDEDIFTTRRPCESRLRGAASFGNIDPNSLSPLLKDRNFFQSAILVNNSNLKSSKEIMTNGDGTFKTISNSSATEGHDKSNKNNHYYRLGARPKINGTNEINSDSKIFNNNYSIYIEQTQPKSSSSSQLDMKHQQQQHAFSQQIDINSNIITSSNNSRKIRDHSTKTNSFTEKSNLSLSHTQNNQSIPFQVSSSGNEIQVFEHYRSKPHLDELNSQTSNSSTWVYMQGDGNTTTFTSAGVAIFELTPSIKTSLKNETTMESVLKAIGRNEPPEIIQDVYPDRACKRTIMQLLVRCYNFGNDCEWTGELGNLEEHLKQCEEVPIACVNTCGRTDIPRNQMNQHIELDGDCPLAVVVCRYNDVGCKHKSRRADMELHLQDCMQQHLDLAHTKIRELEVRQENICMNGKFLWKISNYDHLVKQSTTKKDKEKLCSPPFYTGQYGYKLRAEAFLNGLGQGKGSHLSLYVVIMKGEYDAILPWPFKQNVDFVLIDQDDDKTNRQNKVWKLSCERNSDYFQRPNKAKSLGFGCPKFVSLETLKTRNYIRDQTLFIKIEVEPTDHLIFSPALAH